MAADSYYRTSSAEQHLLSPGLSTGAPSPGHPPRNSSEQHLLSPDFSTGAPSPGYPFHSGQSSPLRPLTLVSNKEEMDAIKEAQLEDRHLKARIRRLRLLSRIIAFLISIAVFVPITLTLHKFLTTKSTFREVEHPDGTTVMRTAWAKDSKVWPTYMYFGVAATALLLHLTILLSYKFGGVEKANKAATVTTWFTVVTMLGNLVVWSVAAGLYRQQKDTGGKSNDLWGWTCSEAAQVIQREFAKEVNFDKFCSVQSVSWYAGLVQVGAALLTVVTYILVLKRRSTKKKIKRQTRMLEGFERVRR